MRNAKVQLEEWCRADERRQLPTCCRCIETDALRPAHIGLTITYLTVLHPSVLSPPTPHKPFSNIPRPSPVRRGTHPPRPTRIYTSTRPSPRRRPRPPPHPRSACESPNTNFRNFHAASPRLPLSPALPLPFLPQPQPPLSVSLHQNPWNIVALVLQQP